MTEAITQPALKPVRYELFEIGERFGPTEVLVDDHFIKKYAFTVDDYHPWSFDEQASPFGARVGQAAILLGDLLRLLNTRYDPFQDFGLHQREQVWFESPVQIGERVQLSGQIVETFVKRGRGYFVTDAVARSMRDGRTIVRHRAIEAAEIGDPSRLGGGSAAPSTGRRIAGVYPGDRDVASVASATVAVGTPLPPLRKVISQEQMSVYSNVQEFWRTTHTDLDAARSQGLQGTLAQGLMAAAYVSQVATGFFGPAWFTTGHLDLAFVAPLGPGTQVRVLGVVSDVREVDGASRVEIETWVERCSDSAKIAVGWADAEARRR
jgi:acyl dehydratase